MLLKSINRKSMKAQNQCIRKLVNQKLDMTFVVPYGGASYYTKGPKL